MKAFALAAIAAFSLYSPTSARAQSANEAYRRPATAAASAIEVRDWLTADRESKAAEAAASSEDEKYYASRLRLAVVRNQNAWEEIIRVTDTLIANGKTPRSHLADYYYIRGEATIRLDRREEALPFLLKARELGSTEPNLPVYLQAASTPRKR